MHDVLIQTLFYVFAALAVLSAFFVISQNNPVRCVLFLVVCFFASAVLWILAEAEFLALILILVYVGAVMTLFLFVVMMLNIDMESIKGHLMRYMPFGMIIVALLTSLLMVALPDEAFKSNVETSVAAAIQSDALTEATTETTAPAKPISNTEALGLVLYTDYIFAFELAAAVLLVAIVAAITLAHRGGARIKRQDITRQIMTKRSDRVELISIKSEK